MRSHEGPVMISLQLGLGDQSTIYKLRAAAAESGQHDVHRLDDWAVVTVSAWRLLGLLEQREPVLRPIRKAERVQKPPEPAAKKKPQAEPKPRVRASTPAEAETFDNVDQDAQAQTLEVASEDGVPFCEECEKARLKREAAAGVAVA